MTNKEILQVFEGINDLKETKIKLNVKTSFNIANIKQQLFPKIKIIEEEQKKIILQYGIKNEDNSITVPNEKIEELNKDMDMLMEINNIESFNKIKLEEFNEEIPYEIIEKLMPILEE